MADMNLSGEQQQQLAVMQIAELMKNQKEMLKLTSKCYQKCQPGAPGKSLGSSEKSCFLNQYLMSQAQAQKEDVVDGTVPLKSVKDPTEGYFA